MLLMVEDEIDCRLMLDCECPTFGGAVILEHLNEILPDLAFEVLQEREGSYIVIGSSTSELYVLISLVPETIESTSLMQSLSSPYVKALSPGIEAAIERHRSYVHITVSNNNPASLVISRMSEELMGDLREMMPPLQSEFPAEMIETKIAICHHIARLLSGTLPVVAIHWGQSDLLLSLDRFVTEDPDDSPSLINVHPFLYSDETAFITLGARHVTGREIDFRPCRVDFSWMLERTLDFLRMARMNENQVIPDGDSFGADENEIIRVRYIQPVLGAVPLIALEVERSLEHGIECSSQPRTSHPTLSSLVRKLIGKNTLN
jgi:hypothetical protein